MFVQKKVIYSSLLSFCLLMLSGCADSTFEFGTELSKIWTKILTLGGLSWLTDAQGGMVSFMRILIVILVFALLYEGAGFLGFSQNIRITISLILAIVSAIFMPATVLATIGATYGTLVALLLIGVPVAGGLYLIFRIPSTDRAQIFIKLVILFILLWVLFAVKNHALDLVGVAKDVAWQGVPYR